MAQPTIAELAEQVTLAEGKLGSLQSKLTDAESRVSARDATILAKDAEIATLRADLATREEQEVARLVDEAIATYKDKKPMSRETMLVIAKDRALFTKEFPPIAPDQRHLLRSITPPETKPGERFVPPTTVIDVQATVLDPSELANAALKLSAEKGIPLDVAQEQVLAANGTR